jgi:IS5 family transposase
LPWQALVALIEPHYPKISSKGGRPPYLLVTMLQVHLMQQWYSLSDPAMEDALIEVPTMRWFASIAMLSDRIPAQRLTMGPDERKQTTSGTPGDNTTVER